MDWLLRFGELALPDAKSRDNAWASSLQMPEVTISQVIVALLGSNSLQIVSDGTTRSAPAAA